MQNALEQARVGRLHILGIMNQTIDKANENISQWAPVIDSFYINPESIGAVIGTAGKVIQKIQKDFNVEITIEEDGKVNIYGPQMEFAVKAKKYIKLLVAEPEIGQIYTGKVKKLMDFGAFVEILPNKDGLLHVSQISHSRVEKASDLLKEGDEIEVKLIKIEKGKISLSRKVLLENPDKKKQNDNSDKNETAE
jgi:polyribonucleotide nucleotidyltransferase